ncbi:MAG TPA: selenide, water dikinase SelD [Thermoanaerobaculia bacterium]
MAPDDWSRFALRGACLAKLPGAALRQLLGHLPGPSIPCEDAVLVPKTSGRLLTTVDFGPLVCPEPRIAGRVAALNAFSDIYAAGGSPLMALAIVVVDIAQPLEFAEQVIAGIAEACASEGAILGGGHTITGAECTAGLSVIGHVQDSTILRKAGALPGDELLISKPIGLGLMLWGRSLGIIDDAALAPAIDVMLTSNAAASRSAVAGLVHASTDITGFGLLGHLSEMLGAEAGAFLNLDQVPLLDGVQSLPPAARTTSAVGANIAYVAQSIAVRSRRPASDLAPLFDAQTNGGLLVAVAPESCTALERHGFTRVGCVTSERAIVVE